MTQRRKIKAALDKPQDEEILQLWKDRLLFLKLRRDLEYIDGLEDTISSNTKQRCRLCKVLFRNKDFVTHYKACQQSMKAKIKLMETSDKIIQTIKSFEIERKKVRITLNISNFEPPRKGSKSGSNARRNSLSFKNAFKDDSMPELPFFSESFEDFEKYKEAAISLTALSKAFKTYIKELKMDSNRAIHDNLIRQKLKTILKTIPESQLKSVIKQLQQVLILIESRLIQVNSIVTKEKLKIKQSASVSRSVRQRTLQSITSYKQVKSKFLAKLLLKSETLEEDCGIEIHRVESLSAKDSLSSNQESLNSISNDSDKSANSKDFHSMVTVGQRHNSVKRNFESCVSERTIQKALPHDTPLRKELGKEHKHQTHDIIPSLEDIDHQPVKKSHFSKYTSFSSFKCPSGMNSGSNSPQGNTSQPTSINKLPGPKKCLKMNLCEQFDRLTESDSGEYFKNEESLVGKINRVSLSDFYYLKTLGKGAFGTVFLVQSKARPDDVFALKIINKASNMSVHELNNLLNERNVFGIVEGEFVTHAISSFVYKNLICFLMEFMPGGDLGRLLNKEEYFDENWTRFYLAEIVLGLESLHKKGIYHRDLKPENLLISQSGHLKLADYGLSDIKKELVLNNASENFEELYFSSQFEMISTSDEAIDKAAALHHKMVPKDNNAGLIRVAGTPDYIAPEILKQGEYSPAADFWALGVIAYELLTNFPPFNGKTIDIVFDKIKRMDIEWLHTGRLVSPR